MKIAIVIEHFDASHGGTEHLAVWVAQQMHRRGHEVHVVCHDVAARINRYRQATLRASFDADNSHRAHLPAEARHEGLHIHRLRGMRLNTALGFRLFGARARRWTRRHQMDVVHSFTVACAGDIYHACSGVYVAMQAQAAASRATHAGAAWKRLVLKLPGKQRTLAALERRAMEGRGAVAAARRIISLCPMMTQQIAEHYGERVRKKVVTLQTPRLAENGSEPLDGAERAWIRGHYGIAARERVALFAGHDFRRKGLRHAIETIARTQDWKLLIVGLGRTREYVEMAEEMGLGADAPRAAGGARVMFVGPTREMEAFYAAADALLLPSFYEPSSLVALEALSHGLPVVSTAFLGAAELVKGHDAGTIVGSPREVAEMAAALEALPAAGSAARKALAMRARSAAADISPEAYLERLAELYEQVRTG